MANSPRPIDLSTITTITIDRMLKRRGKDQFVLSVFLRHQPQRAPLALLSPSELFVRTRQPRFLPTNSTSNNTSSSDGHEPDFEVSHRYPEFVRLRKKLSKIVKRAHRKITPRYSECAFCRPMREFLNHDRTRPRKGIKLFSTLEAQMEHLGPFMRKLVDMVGSGCVEARLQRHQQQPPQQLGDCCNAAFQAALLLNVFLRKPKQSPSLGII